MSANCSAISRFLSPDHKLLGEALDDELVNSGVSVNSRGFPSKETASSFQSVGIVRTFTRPFQSFDPYTGQTCLKLPPLSDVKLETPVLSHVLIDQLPEKITSRSVPELIEFSFSSSKRTKQMSGSEI
jgi:hypothetical protein